MKRDVYRWKNEEGNGKGREEKSKRGRRKEEKVNGDMRVWKGEGKGRKL